MDNLLSYLRLQAELEEAKEEARIQAQEEIVARIQEAKVIIIIAKLWTSGKSMGLVTVHFFFFFLSRRLPSKKWRSRSKSTRRRCQIYMKPWWVMIVLVEACSFKAVNAIQLIVGSNLGLRSSPHSVIGLKNLAQPLNQSDEKLKPITIWLLK